MWSTVKHPINPDEEKREMPIALLPHHRDGDVRVHRHWIGVSTNDS